MRRVFFRGGKVIAVAHNGEAKAVSKCDHVCRRLVSYPRI